MKLNFIVKHQEGGSFFAVCLERYIGAQGATIEQALQRLKIAYQAERDQSAKRYPDGAPFEGIPPAPKPYQVMNEFGFGFLVSGTIDEGAEITIQTRV